MKQLQNNKIAAVIMVLLILISIFIGSGRSLRRLTAQAEDLFYSGASGDGVGVYYDMEKNYVNGANLLVIAARYVGVEHQTYLALSAAAEEFKAASSLSDFADWHVSFADAAYDMYDLLQTYDLSGQDAAYSVQMIVNMEENYDRIARDPYNARAAEIGSTLGRFPANILRTLTGVQKPPVLALA